MLVYGEMSGEVPHTVKGRLLKKGVVVYDSEGVEELERRGYGERDDGRLLLRDYEALYLLYTGRLEVRKGRDPLEMSDLVRFALGRDPDAWTRFMIYRDLRSRGYVVKEGFGFGIDFRVYERGEYGVKPAKYVVFGLNEGSERPVEDVGRAVDEITRMGKEAIIAVIERRGEVIYYKVSKMRFREK